MFFYEVGGHIQKVSSFQQGKKYGLKSHFVYAGPPSITFYYFSHICILNERILFKQTVKRLK